MKYGQRLVRRFKRIRRSIHVNLNIRRMIGNKDLRVTPLAEGKSTVTGKCVITHEEYSCTVPTSGLEAWLNGELIQRAMPEVSADDREFLKSGISPTGWSQAFG